MNVKEKIEETTIQTNENTEEITQKNIEKPQKQYTLILLLTFIGIFLLVLIIIFVIFTIYNFKQKNTISKGIYINGINVSNLTINEAKEKINIYYNELLSNDIKLTHNDFETYISTSEINLSYDIDSAINYAYQTGKNGNIFWDNYSIFDALLNGINIIPTYTLNEDSLNKILDNLSSELPDAVVESSYYIDGNKLIITKGTSGNIVDITPTKNNILQNISNLKFLSNSIEISTQSKEPQSVNLEEIYDEIHKDAKDAYYTTDPYNVYPSENGLDFNISLEEAQTLLSSSENDCTIPLKTLYPNVTTNMIGAEAFPDLLTTFSTKYATANTNRTTNLKLAANKIDGYVLLPNETFSYNAVVGERTISAGYKEAAVYENGAVVQGLGGGICQVSTTLFNCALLANLEIVELHNHQFVPSYVSAGKDATVVYGTKDFQFKNNRTHAIKITCNISKGTATFNIYGVKEETEYDIDVYAKITSKSSTYIKSTTYRTIKSNGTIINNEIIANYTYKAH